MITLPVALAYRLPVRVSGGLQPPMGPGDCATVLRRLQQSELFLEYQQAFEATIGLPLVLREVGSFRPPLHGSKHANPFCTFMNRANTTCAACLQLQARVEASATREAKTLECYAGLIESVVPVLVGDQLLGYLQTGQVFLRPPTRKRFNRLVRSLPGAASVTLTSTWEAAYFQSRVIGKQHYAMILQLLAVFAEHLSAVSNRIFIGLGKADTPFITKTRAFIADHYEDPLPMRDVASAVHMSPCHFCRVFKRAIGQTFTDYLARVRIDSVMQQLLVPGIRVSEAAYAAGFQSLSQFNRQFHRIAGEAPTRYRDRLHGVKHNEVRPRKSAHALNRHQPVESFLPVPSIILGGLCG